MHKTHTVAKTSGRKKMPGLKADFCVIYSVEVWAVVETGGRGAGVVVRRRKQGRDLSAQSQHKSHNNGQVI